MAVCPNCNAELGAESAAGGVCPKCGKPLKPRRRMPKVGAGTVPEATTSFELPPEVQKPAKIEQSPTMIDPTTTGEPKAPRTMTIAPRKLTANNRALITAAWGEAASSATGRTSIKMDSKSSAGLGSSLAVNPRAMRDVQIPGTTVEGADYELLDVIGKGGMGVVYSARQASVDRLVAVKMIRPSVAADMYRRGKFLSEAVVTGDLDHPNIVPIYELGTNEENALFYSMKRVQGTPWSDVIGHKSLTENLDILLKVSDAVAFAHANGVIHRDLKPENVMLGDFGEVLVMDWGLALATSSFKHAEFVTAPDSMGGTPAYMAPEMVTGPFELIGPASDIYLLGAVLYEAATGLRPHHGESAQECLMAAAGNEIQLCEESGELIDIAYRAMSTDPADRFPTVREFQAAIRNYQSHCESLSLAARANHELAEARSTLDYQSFARSLFGFEEALALWDGNTRARAGVSEARLAYAASAKAKGDYELGVSLLDTDDSAHAALRGELTAAQRERNARQKWLTRFKRIAAALAVLVFVVITGSLMVVMQAKNREAQAKEEAIRDKIAAQNAEQAAQQARREETLQKEKAIAAEAKAKQEEALARKAEAAAELAREDERAQKEKAIEAENKAKAEEQKALVAKRGEEYAAYVARIGAAAAKIEENAFDTAASLLAECQPKDRQDNLRHWEWGYLERLCRQGVNFGVRGTVNSVAFSPDGKWFVTGGEDGKAHFWHPTSPREWLAIDHGTAIHGVAVSPDGELVATAGADALVRVANVKDKKYVRTLEGHGDRVLGAAFSPKSGRWLLSWSRDKTARVWDTSTGHEVAGSPLRGHSWWVWSAAFAADERQIVTAGQDGKVIVWSFDPKAAEPIKQQKVFLGHQGAVFAAAFSPDGQQVASAGHDKRILIWQPERVKDVELKQLVANEPVAPQECRAFEGHAAPVRAVAFSADGQYVLSGGDDNTVRIWETIDGKQRSVLRGHSRPVQSCAFSPGSRQVLSGGREGQVKLWNLADYKHAGAHGRVLEGHDDAILSGAFSTDGQRIVTAGRDHTARVYDAASGECLFTLKEGHEFLASRAIYFNHGRWLLTASGDSTVRIWDAATGGQLGSIDGTGRAAAVAVSRDAKWVLTGTTIATSKPSGTNTRAGTDVAGAVDETQQAIALWDLDAEGRSQPHVFPKGQFGVGHRATVTAVAISADGRWLFSGDDSGIGKLWDAATGAERATLKGHTNGITDACFLLDSRRLLTSSNDGTVAQWDVATGEELPLALKHSDAQSRDAYDVPMTAMALSPDGRQLLTLSAGVQGATRHTAIRLWDIERAKLLRELYRGPEVVTSVAFAEGGRAVLAASSAPQTSAAGHQADRSVVRRYDVDTGREITGPGGEAFLDFKGRHEALWSAVDAPRGAGVLSIGGKGAALWDPTNPARPERIFKPHSGVTSAGFSADGKWIVTGSSDHRAKIWNAKTGRAEFQLPAEHTKAITSAEFSPDSRLILTASNDGTARLWDVAGRRMLRVSKHDEGAVARPIRFATFSPDGKNVLTAGDDRTVRIWDTASGRPAGTIKLDAPALCVAWSADAARIIAGCADGKAIVFDARDQRPLLRLSGHTAAVNSVAFSPDGGRALTGSSDRSVKVWDSAVQESRADDELRAAGPADGIEVLTLKDHDQDVTSVAFSPDGRSVLTASLDGTAVVWTANDWNEPRAGK